MFQSNGNLILSELNFILLYIEDLPDYFAGHLNYDITVCVARTEEGIA